MSGPAMDPFYWLVFGVAISAAAVLEWGNRSGGSKKPWDADFRRFKNNYLLVFALMMGTCSCGGPPIGRLEEIPSEPPWAQRLLARRARMATCQNAAIGTP